MKKKILKLGNFELLLEKLDPTNYSDPENYAKKRGLGKGWRFPSPEEFEYISDLKKLKILPEEFLKMGSYWTNFYVYFDELDHIKYSKVKKEIEEFVEEELQNNENMKIHDWTIIVKTFSVGSNYHYHSYEFSEYDEREEKRDATIYPTGGYILVRDLK
jgi:hypothetical protein